MRHYHENPRAYECSWFNCDAKFNERKNLETHELMVHLREEKFKCDYPECDSAFTTKGALDQHRSRHKPRQEKQFSCTWPGCTFSAKQKANVEKHMHVHTRKFFPQQLDLLIHLFSFLGEKKATCPQCGLKVANKATLKGHIKTVHEGEKRFICKIPNCGKRYTAGYSLKTHQMKVHGITE